MDDHEALVELIVRCMLREDLIQAAMAAQTEETETEKEE